MATSTTIYVVRHGQSTWNKEGRWQGRTVHPPLTELGREQAQMAAIFLEDRNVQYVVSSRMERTRETASIMAKHLGIEEVGIIEDLQEKDIGKYAGMMNEEVTRERRENEAAFLEEIESDADLGIRIERALREIGKKFPNKTVLAVSHSGFIRCAFRHLGTADPSLANLEGCVVFCDNENEKISLGDRILPPRPTDQDRPRTNGSGIVRDGGGGSISTAGASRENAADE